MTRQCNKLIKSHRRGIILFPCDVTSLTTTTTIVLRWDFTTNNNDCASPRFHHAPTTTIVLRRSRYHYIDKIDNEYVHFTGTCCSHKLWIFLVLGNISLWLGSLRFINRVHCLKSRSIASNARRVQQIRLYITQSLNFMTRDASIMIFLSFHCLGQQFLSWIEG